MKRQLATEINGFPAWQRSGLLPPARRDTRLEDRPGEEWADIPGLDGHYWVSNQGRIKRLGHLYVDKLGRPCFRPAKIKLAQVNKTPNVLMHDSTFRLQVTMQNENQKYSFMVMRLVYCMFVKEFDLHDQTLNVVPVNGDGFDIRPDNLVLLNVPDRCMRTYKKKRLLCPKDINPVAFRRGVRRSMATTSRPVSSYDQTGNRVAMFPSAIEASRQLGVWINTALRNPYRLIGGYYWRHGDAAQIDLRSVHEQQAQAVASYSPTQAKPVTQFDREGNIIGHYPALLRAAKAVGTSSRALRDHLNGKYPQAGGYLWKRGIITNEETIQR